MTAVQRLALRWRRQGLRVALVPTMGALHAGHVSLVHRARRLVGPRGVVVVSIYVNPTQFGPREDLARYPRNLTGDSRLCRAAGVDVLVAPRDEEMYRGRSERRFSTYVVEESLSRSMEGASRPTHFRGVTTIVAKLFNLVLPEVAVFGAKDFQQAAIIGRMVANLNFPVKIDVAPTVREPDGLAMSSRNRYLTATQRREAAVLSECLGLARRWVTERGRVPAAVLRRRLVSLVEKRPDCRVDYLALFNPETLEPVKIATVGDHLALAVFVGSTRLIDNERL